MQRALYALVRESLRESVYSGAHATHARVELAYGGPSHASGARDGVAEPRSYLKTAPPHLQGRMPLYACPTVAAFASVAAR